ncbi:MAG: metallophosphoesterase [Anaerolineae bacterium]|nr:metallophosphoesterase [Anaerolineae bacterium]
MKNPNGYMTRRRFLQLAGAGLALTATGGAGYVYASRIEPERLAIEHISLRLPHLDPAFDGYRLIQISDVHMDHRHMTRDRLLGVVSLVNAQQPDFVVVTGDFVTRGNAADYADSVVIPLRELRTRDGAAAVLGNHDHWASASAVRQMIADAGLIDLNNRVHTKVRGGAQFHITGVDDIWENHHRLDRVLDALPLDGAAILLAHEPDFADESAATARFDLQLSGHTHGGQCVLPGGAMPILPELGHKYPSGLYRVGDMWQYTNRGLGMTWFPQVRFNCRPEISVFTLRAGRERAL